MTTDTNSPVIARVRDLIAPIAADLHLDVYDVEQRGGTLRISLDTPAGAADGITLDTLALASRLMSKELDQHDPIPSHYTLEVTSPGIERPLRTPEHFRREMGKVAAVRLANVPGPGGARPGTADERRVRGVIVAAGDERVTIRTGDVEREIRYVDIDRARTVFEWEAKPKPGKQGAQRHPGKQESKETS